MDQDGPLERLRAAVKNVGGVSAAARIAGLNRTHLANVLGGSAPLGRDTASRLRPVVTLSAEDWVELMAPPPDEAHTC